MRTMRELMDGNLSATITSATTGRRKRIVVVDHIVEIHAGHDAVGRYSHPAEGFADQTVETQVVFGNQDRFGGDCRVFLFKTIHDFSGVV